MTDEEKWVWRARFYQAVRHDWLGYGELNLDRILDRLAEGGESAGESR